CSKKNLIPHRAIVVEEREYFLTRLGKLIGFCPPEGIVRRASAPPEPGHTCALEQTILVQIGALLPKLRVQSCRLSVRQSPFHRQTQTSQIFRHYKPPVEPKTALRNSSESGV